MSRELFEKWAMKENYSPHLFRTFNNGVYVDMQFRDMFDAWIASWQACAEEKDKRIAELEAENAETLTSHKKLHISLAKATVTIIELQKQNKELVEALEACKYDCNTGEVIGIAKEALATVA